MGIPKFFRWLSERYPMCSQVVSEGGVPEFDNFYLDMNGIVHTVSRSIAESGAPFSETDVFVAVFAYVQALYETIRPRSVFFLAVDGVAPRAKVNQQRARRYRSSHEAAIEREKAARRSAKGKPLVFESAAGASMTVPGAGQECAAVVCAEDARFDSNCITPGTRFMARLSEHLRFMLARQMSEDPGWQHGVQVIFSGAEVPGEGEHKIMEYIRLNKARAGYNENTRHCVYGLDADLILLGLLSHDPHFALLREEVVFGKAGARGGAPSRVKTAADTKFYLLHLSLMREYLSLDFSHCAEDGTPGLGVSLLGGAPDPRAGTYSVERVIDDFILLMCIVGNDFLPGLPHFHLGEGVLDAIFAAYKRVLPTFPAGAYVNDNGSISFPRLGAVLSELVRTVEIPAMGIAFESAFETAKDTDGTQDGRAGALLWRAIEDFLEDDGVREWRSPGGLDGAGVRVLHDAAFECRLLFEYDSADASVALAKGGPADAEYARAVARLRLRAAALVPASDDAADAHAAQKAAYYAEKVGLDAAGVRAMADALLAGMQWTMRYYYAGVASWTWFYPHHYAPFASDVAAACASFAPPAFELGRPLLPLQQLMAVLPPASAALVPRALAPLMEDGCSPVSSFYPRTFRTDANGKKQAWEHVVLIPFIDVAALTAAMAPLEAGLADEERARNVFGETVQYVAGAQAHALASPAADKALLPDLAACRARCVPYALPVLAPDERFVAALCRGAALGVHTMPGFPSLATLGRPLRCELRGGIGLDVFGQPARRASVVLSVPPGADPLFANPSIDNEGQTTTQSHGANDMTAVNQSHFNEDMTTVNQSHFNEDMTRVKQVRDTEGMTTVKRVHDVHGQTTIKHVHDTVDTLSAEGRKRVAEALLRAARVHVEWPYLREARVSHVTDGTTRYTLGPGGAVVAAPLDTHERTAGAEAAARVAREYRRRCAVVLGDTAVVVWARAFAGMEMRADGSVAAAFEAQPRPFPLQVVVARRVDAAGAELVDTRHAARRAADAAALFPPGTTAVCCLPGPLYGALVRVLGPSGGNGAPSANAQPQKSAGVAGTRSLGVEIVRMAPTSSARADACVTADEVGAGWTAAQRVQRAVGLSPPLLAKLASRIVLFGDDGEMLPGTAIGLGIKFEARAVAAIGMARRTAAHRRGAAASAPAAAPGWEYSSAAVRVLAQLRDAFPALFARLEAARSERDMSAASVLGLLGEDGTPLTGKALRTAAVHAAAPVQAAVRAALQSVCGPDGPILAPTDGDYLLPATVRALEALYDAPVDAARPPAPPNSELPVAGVMSAHTGPLRLLGHAQTFAVGDRVVCVGSVAFGAAGTVVGIELDTDSAVRVPAPLGASGVAKAHKTPAAKRLRVLLDAPLPTACGLDGQCSDTRGVFLVLSDCLNVSRPQPLPGTQPAKRAATAKHAPPPPSAAWGQPLPAKDASSRSGSARRTPAAAHGAGTDPARPVKVLQRTDASAAHLATYVRSAVHTAGGASTGIVNGASTGKVGGASTGKVGGASTGKVNGAATHTANGAATDAAVRRIRVEDLFSGLAVGKRVQEDARADPQGSVPSDPQAGVPPNPQASASSGTSVTGNGQAPAVQKTTEQQATGGQKKRTARIHVRRHPGSGPQ